MKRLLIANRGEVAVRIARAGADMGVACVGVFSEDDADALHRVKTRTAHPLRGVGPAAYLDIEQILDAASEHGCDAIHPGYGFLSERADFAEACAKRGITFVGPSPDVLRTFGDKSRARKLAQDHGVPVLDGVPAPASLDDVRGLLTSGPVMMKAVAGGGGRGMRVVRGVDGLEEAFQRCQSEAKAAFGVGDLYAERFLSKARHIEVQIIGDGTDVAHVWTRECSLQRRHQKIVEIAPAPWLSSAARTRLLECALALGGAMPYRGLGTVEFLLGDNGELAFIEVNPRLQVEHTVTEAVCGIDLVRAQIALADGATLAEVGLNNPPKPRGYALQARVNMEKLGPDGQPMPAGGRISIFEPPLGPGVRVDAAGYSGYRSNPRFDALLAKIIVHSTSDRVEDALNRAWSALCECRIEGVDTNLDTLRALVKHPELRSGAVHTGFVEAHLAELTMAPEAPRLYVSQTADNATSTESREEDTPGRTHLRAPMDGTLVQSLVSPGQAVSKGTALAVLSAMKMEHVVEAPESGLILEVRHASEETVNAGQTLFVLSPSDVGAQDTKEVQTIDPALIRADLAEALERVAATQDAARPEAVAKRRKQGMRTARENIADLCDEGSFVEYGGLALPAQRGGRTTEDLIARAPADGIVTGVGAIEGTQCAVLSYDYTVMAGTQGWHGHRKTDRLLRVAREGQLPVIFFTEGGGGRPNDTDLVNIMVSGLECASFSELAVLSGEVPLIGVGHGRCFAGNAAMLGCCDIIIATEASNIGMGGPAMIEGGGLGVWRPEDIGPIDDQTLNGTVDIKVADEIEAVAMARQVLAWFSEDHGEWGCEDQRLLRSVVPPERLRVYDMHRAIEALADTGSVVELQPRYGPGMITAMVRIEGRPVGVIANNPSVMAGAIDTSGAGKAARFMRLCNTFGRPILFLCDTPGIMVGPEAERSGTVRAAGEMFIRGASLTVPFFTIVLRKAYGLGAQAMAGGHFKAPRFIVSWPSGEFGPMGLEGAVRLGFRRQLEAVKDPAERQAMFDQMVALLYERGKALNVASHFEIDAVIDPADTRRWILSAL